MACKLSNDQLDALYKATVGEIVADKNSGRKFDPTTFMKKIYDAISAATGDTANGIDYVQHIPWAINLAQGLDMEIADYLMDSGIDMNAVNKMRRDFDDINNIINFLGLNKNAELETAKEIIAEALPQPIVDTKEYDSVETKDEQLKDTVYKQIYKTTETGEFIAKPATALATINQEAKDYDGVSYKDNVIDDDTQKQSYFKIVRLLNNLIAANGAINADNVQIGDVKGIFFKAVPARTIPTEDLYARDRDYFSKDDDPSLRYGKTKEQKMQDREKGSDMYLVFSDKDGKILYFDENANITTKEDGGKPLYTTIRRVSEKNGKKFVFSAQYVSDVAKRSPFAMEELEAAREVEIEVLERLRNYVKNNPKENILLSVAPGKNGFVKEDYSKKNTISSIDIDGGFSPYYAKNDDAYHFKGGVYFNVSDYELPVLIKRPKFSEIPDLVEGLANLLFDSKEPNFTKEKIGKQFFYSRDTSIIAEEDGSLKVKQGADVLDTSKPEDKQKFITNLNNQLVNINKTLINGFYTEPTVVNGQLKLNEGRVYDNFLADHFYTHLEVNADKKVVKLNAYNVFQLTTDATNKLFKVEKPAGEIIQQPSLTSETPSDQTLDDFERAIRNLDTGLKKLKNIDNKATKEQIAEAQRWYDNHPLKAYAPYSVMLNVVNSDAFAQWTQAGIFLYQGSNFTDLYHESWHVFSQMYLTRDQKKKLYGEVGKLSGTFKTYDGKTIKFSKATDKQIEEFLAEDFRKYVLSKGTKIFDNRPVATNIFAKIWNFLKALFKGQSIKSILADGAIKGTVKELYDKLHVGNVNEYKPSLANVQFSILNKGIQDLNTKEDENKGLNYQDSLEIVQTIDGLIASLLSQYNLSVSTVFTNPELLGSLYGRIKNELAKIKEKLLTETKETASASNKEIELLEKKRQDELNKYFDSNKSALKDQIDKAIKDKGWEVDDVLFHGGPKFDKFDKQFFQTGEYSNIDMRRVAQSMGVRIPEGSFSFSPTPELALTYAVKYGKNNPTLYIVKNTKSLNAEELTGNEEKDAQEWIIDGDNISDVISVPLIPNAVEINAKYDKLISSKQVVIDPRVQVLDRVLENWGDFNKVIKGEQDTGVIAYHKKKTEFLTFDDKYLDMLPEEKAEQDGEVSEGKDDEGQELAKKETELREEFGLKAFENTGREHSVRELASDITVYLVKTLPAVDKNGKIEVNKYGVQKPVDFNRMWGIIINAVAGSRNKTEMYNKIVEQSAVFPELKILKERLGDPNKKTNVKTDNPYIKTWGAFFRDFSMYRIPMKELQLIKKGGYRTETDSRGVEKVVFDTSGFALRFVDSSPLFQQVENNFVNYFQTMSRGKYIKRDYPNNKGVNALNLDKIFQDFPDYTKLSEGDNAFNFYHAIGIPLTDNSAVRSRLTKPEYDKVKYLYFRLKRAKQDYDLLSPQAKLNWNPITNPIQFFKTDENLISQKLRDENKGFLGRNQSNDINAILELEGKYSTNYSNNSISNVKGDREYDLSLNSSLTQFLKEINNTNIKEYKDLVIQPHLYFLDIERNPNAKYGLMLNSVFHLPVLYKPISTINQGLRRIEKGNASTIEILNLNGIKSLISPEGMPTVSEGGIKTANLDGNSKFLFDLHTMLEEGTMELTRRASKSSSFGVRASNLVTEFNEGDRTSYINIGRFTENGQGVNNTISLLKEKLAAELERIAIIKEDIDQKGELSKIPGFAERAKTLLAFDDMLGSDESLANELIEAANIKDSFNLVVKSDKFNNRISEALQHYLEKLYQENMEVYNEMGYVSDSLKKKIRDKAKGEGQTVTDSQIAEVAVRAFTSNALIHNMEVAALFDGDLANFNHDKDEYHKRNAYITSTGRIFSVDDSDLSIINSDEYYNSSYAKTIDAPKRNYSNGILNSVVFKDNILGSIYRDDYIEALVATGKYTEAEAKKIVKKYGVGEINEGDAQGWITFDAYKTLSILEGNKWSPKQAELYQKIINKEEVDPVEITEFFPPLKYQYAGPLLTEKLDVRAFHKYSLMPLIPSVIKGTNLQTLHDNLVKQGNDYALFQSGSKLSTLTTDGSYDSFYENDDYGRKRMKKWNPGDPEYKKNPIFIHYLKNQVDIATKWKNKTIFSTQLRKLIINDLFRQGVPLNSDFGKLVEEFEQTLDDLQSFKKQELLEDIGWTTDKNGQPTGDMKSLIKFVRKELSRQGLPDHVVEFVDTDDSGKTIRYDLSYSLAAEQIEKLLNAIVVKRLIRQKLNGEQLVQVSGAGFESKDYEFRFKNNPEDIKKYRGTNDLPFYRPILKNGKLVYTTAMKVKIAMKGDYYKLLELDSVKKYAQKEKITPLQALNILLKDDNWLNEDDNRKLVTLVGVRIPVQGFNSMEFMEVYEFLPEEAGNVLIPPAEIVTKSGGDFDIDKLTVFQPNYDSSKKHAVYARGNNVKGAENKVIEYIRRILEKGENFDALIRPNDTDLVKGVADQLELENVQGYNPYANKTLKDIKRKKDGKAKISPTRVFEQKYNNIYKHNSNNIGKATLGIGAVDNSYSSIFKRIGARLMTNYTFYPFNRNVRNIHNRRVNIAFDHNRVTVNGVEYISLSDINSNLNKVSDLISQLMNGWVDIEKDAWIFNINGNSIAGPVLLFLLETGVDFKTAAYFVSQPSIIEYIKRRYQSTSPFYEPSDPENKKNQAKGLNKFEIRKDMIRMFEIVDDKGFSGKTLYQKHIEPNTREKFTEDELLKNIKSKDLKSDVSKRALMHFFELEDMGAQLTKVKLTVNVDTKPDKTFFSAQTRLLDIEQLDEVDIVPASTVKDIKTKSPIKSFFVQNFQLNLFKPIMSVRADKKINDFILEKIKEGNIQEQLGLDENQFQNAFKNDISLYLLQNYLKGVKIDEIKEYGSLAISQTLPLKEVQLKYGAFVKGGTMYIDKDQIREDFENKAYSGKGYEDLGLYKLKDQYFSFTNNKEIDFQEYSHFVLERELLRSITPSEGKTREEYEEEIAKKALDNTYNFYHNLKSDDSIANVFTQIQESTTNLPNEYIIFDQLVAAKLKSDKGIKTLKFRSSKLDADMANALHENLVRLSDPGTIKLSDPQRNNKLSEFFRKFIIAEYLRAGTSKSNDSLAQILPTDRITKLLQQEISNFKISDKFLNQYYEAFRNAWSRNRYETRNKFRNYLPVESKPTVQAVEKTTEDYLSFVVKEDEKGVKVFRRPSERSEVTKLADANPGFIFLYVGNEGNINEPLGIEYKKTKSIPIPLKPLGGVTNLWTDAQYDKKIEVIDNALKTIDEAIENGEPVAFPEEGFVQFGDKNILGNAPKIFEYFAKELYRKYNYVHPGADNLLGFRTMYQQSQDISDIEVEEFIKKCFGQ